MSTEIIEIETTGENLHLATTEINFGKILVATDFSTPATQALKTAMAICRAFGSELVLVHAALPFYYGADGVMVPCEVLTMNLDAAREQMENLVASDPALQALHPTTTVEFGDALDIITQTAHDQKADLIIVGSHGAKGLERLALGSVAECVLRQATCPVLIVGPHCKPEPFPFRSIVFATDLTATGLRGAQYATGLAERFHGRITLLHVIEKKKRTPGIEPELIEQRIKHELQRLLPADVDQYSKSEIRVEYGPAAEMISNVAHQECASMVVVGLQERGSMADHTPWSTLCHLTNSLACAILGVRGHLK